MIPATDKDGNPFLAPWASVYGLLVAIAKMPWSPLAPLREATGEVVARRINDCAGKDVPVAAPAKEGAAP